MKKRGKEWSIEYLSALVKENKEESGLIIATEKYFETRVEEIIHLRNVLKKYDL